MAGYRDTSNYEPLPRGDYGRPLRPFNVWQWLGVGITVAGVLVVLAALASKLGWLPPDVAKWLTSGTALCFIGAVFVNSRRETVSPEETEKRRRQALIGVGIGLAISAVLIAAILYFKGA